MDNIVIKIFDSVNNFDFEIPLNSNENSAFSISKSISDLTDLTSRSGVQSRNFNIVISKDVQKFYDYLNQSQHHNQKDVDADKEAVILVNGNELERGKIRVINYSTNKGNEELELLFFGNNYDWKEEIKNLTLADLEWDLDTIIYNPPTIKGSWDNSVANGDEWVFPLENRGGRKLLSMVHTEDFRPALFLYSVIKKGLKKIGYTFESNFFETLEFKKLVLTFFGTRFKNTKKVINDNKVEVKFDETGTGGVTFDAGYFHNLNPNFNNVEAVVSSVNVTTTLATFNELIDGNNNFNPTAGTIQVKGGFPLKAGQFTAPIFGRYLFNLETTAFIYSEPINQSNGNEYFYTFFLRKFDSSGNQIQAVSGISQGNSFIGSCTGSNTDLWGRFEFLSGEVVVELLAGERVELWRQYHSNGSANDFNLFEFTITECQLSVELMNDIIEGNSFNLSDVVDDKVKLIDIINDFSRMFNLFWDADTVLKKITVEPRDDFYGTILTAKEVTQQIDNDSEIKVTYNSSFHVRDLIFQYTDDDKDVFVEERDKEKDSNLAEYKHSLPNKFQKGTRTISTSVLAATYILRDVDSLGLFQANKAPYTSMYWNTFTNETPLEMLEDHAPRILCYQYAVQNGTIFNTTNAYKFRFYDETNDRVLIPSVLPHQIKIDGIVIANASMNLYWHTNNEQDGLFIDYWSKTITEIVSGLKASCKMYFDVKQWKEFSFRNVAYINKPIELKGYWLFEKKDNYQPEVGGFVDVELLKRIEYEPQVEGVTSLEEDPVLGSMRITGNNTTAMKIIVEDNDGNSIDVNMTSENNEPLI